MCFACESIYWSMGGVVCCTSILVVFVIHNHKSRNLVGPLYDGCNKCGDFILGFHCQLLFTVVVIQLGSVFFLGIKIWCFVFLWQVHLLFDGSGHSLVLPNSRRLHCSWSNTWLLPVFCILQLYVFSLSSLFWLKN